ncbi:hypothetical protein [Parapedobacter indicus]|uniref:Uncharacterized protein n=1 Tax=Parapedobacter indicus TaxID=1477437 RepID=A0A1I3FYA2_9SPHI|nr:hypothetical protein [Parapedobacter indicus]PPL03947.1 hypothetical protein CLV26_102555 [Parapedobacter indicus]SFI16210.1 hypothetical protein SAMN05444682_102555 [Parapedobacter indicus]
MNHEQLQSELLSIRHLMERSAKFISLSGLSGILAGCYALVGAALGYREVYGLSSKVGYRDHYVTEEAVLVKLVIIASVVLLLSIGTAIWLSARKARKQGQGIWNPASRGLLNAVGVPLVAGGLFVLVMIARGTYGLVAPACLIFYGLALVAGSQYTYRDVKGLGILQIVLGLLAACLPGYSLIFWSLGFGVLHILYGFIMYVKYERGVA